MSRIVEAAMESKAWPFEEARRVLSRAEKLNKSEIIFETGYGPSGLPHIGTFAEVARTTMVMNAFKIISNIPTRLIVFSDDMDGFRKVPDNVPEKEMLEKFIGKPLTSVPDPFGTCDSFATHNNTKLCEFLNSFGFEYEFMSATRTYQAGIFNETLLKVLTNYDAITNIILPTLGPDRRATYSPFMPICRRTGHVLQVPIIRHDATTITYIDPETSEEITTPVIDGAAKLQWKVDWAMRWVALGIDYEMSGKDLIDSVKLSTQIARVLGVEPPANLTYELFLDIEAKKISKSKGNGLSVEEWMDGGTKNSLSLFMYQKPREAKRIHWDIIPKMEDEYIHHLSKFNTEVMDSRVLIDEMLLNPVFHIEGMGANSKATAGLSYSLLLNLAGVANSDNPTVLWTYIQKHNNTVSPETHPYLNTLVHKAINHYIKKVEPAKVFRSPDDIERMGLENLKMALNEISTVMTAAEIHSIVLNVGRKFERYQDMNAKGATIDRPGVSGKWFQAIYEVLLGQSTGPRLGSFIELFGIDQTIALIEEKLS